MTDKEARKVSFFCPFLSGGDCYEDCGTGYRGHLHQVWNLERTGHCGVKEHATNARNGGRYVMERAVEILRQYDDFEAIGISTAGQVNSADGYIRYANENIPGYTGMKVREIMEREFHVPVAVENDVNAAAIGEGQFGAGRDFQDFLCITYGTGVGGAIVMNKGIYTGSACSAGEFGGIMIHPEDSVYGEPFCGCYEKYASTTALVRRAMAYNRDLTMEERYLPD